MKVNDRPARRTYVQACTSFNSGTSGGTPLVEQWGYNGFEPFTRDVYRVKRDIFDKSLQEHLGDVAERNKPESGLFFWYVHSCTDCMESSPLKFVAGMSGCRSCNDRTNGVKLLLDPDGDGKVIRKNLFDQSVLEWSLSLPGTSWLLNGQKSANVRLLMDARRDDARSAEDVEREKSGNRLCMHENIWNPVSY